MASAGSAANADAAAKFWGLFQQQKEEIKEMASKDQDITQRLRSLDSSLREAFIYLPAYDQKQFTRDLDELRALLHKRGAASSGSSAAVSSGQSRVGGFRFKSAVTRSAGPPQPSAAGNQEAGAREAAADIKETVETMGTMGAKDAATSFGFAEISGAWVVAEPRQQAAQTDCELRDIADSVIDLRPISRSLRALNCHRIRNSLVICGPFAGSATVRDSSNCTLVLGVRQFRLEGSTAVDVFVYCTSHPIIEKSSAVRFAPFPHLLLASSKIQQDFAVSGLGRLPNTFDKVDDFNWLKRQASPNWSINAGSSLDPQDGAETWGLLADQSSRPLGKALERLLPSPHFCPKTSS